MEWININDEQPPYFHQVLVITHNMSAAVAWMASGDDNELFFTIGSTDRIIEDVAYWVWIPNPPKDI